MREPLNTMLETMKSVYGVVVSTAQEKYLNEIDDAYANGRKSLVGLVSEFIDMFGQQYIDCVPIEVMKKFGYVPEEESVEENVEENMENDMTEVKTMASLSGNETVHELTMRAMSSLEPIVPVSTDEIKANVEVKDMIKPITENVVVESPTINKPKVEAIPMTLHLDTPVESIEPVTSEAPVIAETSNIETPSTESLNTEKKDVDVLDVTKKDSVDVLVEHLVSAITEPAPLPDDVVVPCIEYTAADPTTNENYKLIPVSWLHSQEYNISYLKNMIIMLGRLVGIEATYDNRDSIEKVYTKICDIIKKYDLIDFDVTKHKEQVESLNNEIESLKIKQNELLNEISTLRVERSHIIPSEPIGQYVISLSIQSKTYYISNIDEKSGLMVTSHLKKAVSYDQLSDALSVLDYLVQHAEEMKLKQDILATVEVKQLGLCKV